MLRVSLLGVRVRASVASAEKTKSLSRTWRVTGDLVEHNTVGKGEVILEESGLVKNRNVFSVFISRNKDGMCSDG